MSLATGHQDDSRADHQQTTNDVEDRGTDATGAGERSALLVDKFLIIALILFAMLKAINKATALGKKKEKEDPTTKICPKCQSEINIKAVKCPCCTSDLEA